MSKLDVICWLQIGTHLTSWHDLFIWLGWFANPLFDCSV